MGVTLNSLNCMSVYVLKWIYVKASIYQGTYGETSTNLRVIYIREDSANATGTYSCWNRQDNLYGFMACCFCYVHCPSLGWIVVIHFDRLQSIWCYRFAVDFYNHITCRKCYSHRPKRQVFYESYNITYTGPRQNDNT